MFTMCSSFSLIIFSSYWAFRSPKVPSTYWLRQQLVLPLHNVYTIKATNQGIGSSLMKKKEGGSSIFPLTLGYSLQLGMVNIELFFINNYQ